jgi:hypothetical protein
VGGREMKASTIFDCSTNQLSIEIQADNGAEAAILFSLNERGAKPEFVKKAHMSYIEIIIPIMDKV